MPRITVGIRFRPEETSNKLQGLSFTSSDNSNENNNNCIELIASNTKHEFNFDKIFDESSDQSSVFCSCTQPIVDQVLEGYNGCIFAYGQTGAGKTYTMTGPANNTENYINSQSGICIRVASYIFERINKIADDISIRLSILELYNENLTDLLLENIPSIHNNNVNMKKPKLTIVDTVNGVIIPGLHVLPITTEEEALNLLYEAQANRAVAEHQLNRKSSRSHVVYIFYVTRTKPQQEENPKDDPEVTQSKLHLVDLAGSERTSKTGSTGTVQKEANHINRSLSYLEQVVIALTQSKRDHIPFRQSKLTYLLKDSLGGNCNTYMIACIWPNQQHLWETLSTLRFAARMKNIETHPVRNSLVSKDINSAAVSSKYIQQIDLLKKELVMKDLLMKGSIINNYDINPGNTFLPELTKHQKFKTYKQCYNMVLHNPPNPMGLNNSDEKQQNQNINIIESHMVKDDLSIPDGLIDIQSLSHVNLLLGILKNSLYAACNYDQNVVITTLRNTILAHNTPYLDKLSDLLPAKIENMNIIQGNSSDNIDGYRENDSIKIKNDSMDEKIKFDVDMNGIPLPLNNNILPKINESNRAFHFEYFKENDGKKLNDSYEELKEALASNKLRQKDIVTLLNNQKGFIDDYEKQINDINHIIYNNDNNNNNDTDNKNNKNNMILNEKLLSLQVLLDTSKKTYRSAHNELKLCKDQINETQSLKKRSMTALLNAFAEYERQYNNNSSHDNNSTVT
eukprot:gene8944-12061_t